ncbi:uncharacterized protein BX663DRAFT_511976 [Cokeromyces recurvatus]|uniref:uncharacterized protein n=1 Tax=Cokeromyces recurvatus TaxID=90255 RepID=UPI00221EF12F|nr:uncharacterized protein BX663DRAFT_511976 [Cokeromyces recurvatus]KAI7902175.1 hypothetical protein BX663DRAFT_511976 [Cokeromyces recurvatus]
MNEDINRLNNSFKVFEKPSKEPPNGILFSSGSFNVGAKDFIPSQKATQSFNPFDASTDLLDEEDNIDDLSQRFITSNLLDEVEESNPLSTSNEVPMNTTFVAQWNTLNDWNQYGPENIWSHDDSRKENKKTDYYSENEQEFDPTLHFYHGTLYDAATIQDMNRLSLNVTNPSPEEVQKDNVEEDMSTLQMLQTIFSDLNDEELIDTLEKYDYDVDRAIEALLSQKLPSVTTNTIVTSNHSDDIIPKKRQVCRHFLAGECYRKDCWFSHDLQDKVCKFWLQGSCLKGDSCEFLHKIDIQEVANKMALPEIKTKKEQVKLNQNDYPELKSSYSNTKKKNSSSSSCSSSSSNGGGGSFTVSQQQSMNRVAAAVVVEEFPTLASAVKMKNTVQPINYSHQGKEPINFAEAAKKNKGQSIHKAVKSVYTTGDHLQKRGYRYSMQELKQPVQIPWLETGSSLNSIYMKEREKAIEYGMLRNRFFSKATEYYLKGDGARAKLFSMEAKHYNRLMQEMHKEASQRIFEQRSKHEAFIDLHGLHEDEAMDIIHERLQQLKLTYHGIIYIVTGTGHHSGASGLSKKQSKLKPVVYNYLKQENYRFAETSIVGDNQGGIFAVEI